VLSPLIVWPTKFHQSFLHPENFNPLKRRFMMLLSVSLKQNKIKQINNVPNLYSSSHFFLAIFLWHAMQVVVAHLTSLILNDGMAQVNCHRYQLFSFSLTVGDLCGIESTSTAPRKVKAISHFMFHTVARVFPVY